MRTMHWAALIVGLVGVALIVIGLLQQRDAAKNPKIVGGFGGPPGSSDVATKDGYPEANPYAHFVVGRTARLIGLALVLVALGLVIYSWVR